VVDSTAPGAVLCHRRWPASPSGRRGRRRSHQEGIRSAFSALRPAGLRVCHQPQCMALRFLHSMTETNRIHLVLFGMQNRTFFPICQRQGVRRLCSMQSANGIATSWPGIANPEVAIQSAVLRFNPWELVTHGLSRMCEGFSVCRPGLLFVMRGIQCHPLQHKAPNPPQDKYLLEGVRPCWTGCCSNCGHLYGHSQFNQGAFSGIASIPLPMENFEWAFRANSASLYVAVRQGVGRTPRDKLCTVQQWRAVCPGDEVWAALPHFCLSWGCTSHSPCIRM
jgi:hypothetical protein